VLCSLNFQLVYVSALTVYSVALGELNDFPSLEGKLFCVM